MNTTFLERLGLALFMLLTGLLALSLRIVWLPIGVLATLFDARFAVNSLVLDDLTLNTILLGPPTQTVSQRVGWARDSAGKPWGSLATSVCAILTWCGKRIGATCDHCTMATSGGTPTGFRIWRWSSEPLEIVVFNEPTPGVSSDA